MTVVAVVVADVFVDQQQLYARVLIYVRVT